MSRSKSSHAWLKEHFSDPFVKRAWQEGYRSRAAYKLEWIQKKDKIFKKGMTVVDLGAAPGGWAQVASLSVGKEGRVVALDCLPILPLPHVHCIQGDFREACIIQQLMNTLSDKKVDCVLSDLAPNLSGNRHVDLPKMIGLIELVMEFAYPVLKPGGTLLTKIFQGEGFDAVLSDLRKHFKTVVIRKPEASRDRSRECYLLARDYLGESTSIAPSLHKI